MVYYVATADVTRSDVDIFVNYNNNDPAAGWAMQRVLDQANAAQNKYGNPESEHYIPNYNVIVSTNAAGYNMSTGEPGGLLVMGGVEYHAVNSEGFFGVTKDGKPVFGSAADYNNIYRGQLRDGVAGFGTTLVKDGKIVGAGSGRASRTAIGITKTGKIVLMVFDGRQEPWSCGGSYIEIAQIMLEAGCVNAVNLTDGIDGLASGVTLPVMVFFAVVAWARGSETLALFPAAIVGGLIGFLCYNFHPAKVFMGDTGSLFLGGAVCGMAFALDMPLILILVGIVYIMETVSVMMQVVYFKLTHGKRIFRMTPIHHHFEMGGWSEVKIFCVFTGITVVMCLLSWIGIH